MKTKTKRNYLLWVILSTFLIAWIMNATNNINIPNKDNLHRISLFSLFLSNDNENSAQMKVSTWWNNLDVLNGIIINNNNAWVAWGQSNIVNWEIWAIGWGQSNIVNWEIWVVAGWNWNTAGLSWVILWWNRNKASNGGVVLWGNGNEAKNNSIALWQNAKWDNASFVWNKWDATNGSARINASGWMLIWTYKSIDWVSLVVSWAIKLWKDESNTQKWSISDENWCIKFYNWSINYAIGRNSEKSCWLNTWCQFGTIILYNGDKVDGYRNLYASSCNTVTVTCKNWNLYVDGNTVKNMETIYPNCYKLSNNHAADPNLRN